MCPAPIQREQNECLLGILAADPASMANCPLEPGSGAIEMQKLGTGALLLYTPGGILQERCLHIGTRGVSSGPWCKLRIIQQ